MSDSFFLVHRVSTGWGVFDPGLEYLYKVFDTREDAERWCNYLNFLQGDES